MSNPFLSAVVAFAALKWRRGAASSGFPRTAGLTFTIQRPMPPHPAVGALSRGQLGILATAIAGVVLFTAVACWFLLQEPELSDSAIPRVVAFLTAAGLAFNAVLLDPDGWDVLLYYVTLAALVLSVLASDWTALVAAFISVAVPVWGTARVRARLRQPELSAPKKESRKRKGTDPEWGIICRLDLPDLSGAAQRRERIGLRLVGGPGATADYRQIVELGPI